MLSVLKKLNKSFSTIKNIKPNVKAKKHKYDIENESWVKPKKRKRFRYSYIQYIIDIFVSFFSPPEIFLI